MSHQSGSKVAKHLIFSEPPQPLPPSCGQLFEKPRHRFRGFRVFERYISESQAERYNGFYWANAMCERGIYEPRAELEINLNKGVGDDERFKLILVRFANVEMKLKEYERRDNIPACTHSRLPIHTPFPRHLSPTQM